MSALNPQQQPSPAPISNATASDGAESGSIHPVTWMAIGGGLIGIVVVLAVLLGFFGRGTPQPATTATHIAIPAHVATQTPAAPDSAWVDDLWGPSTAMAVAESADAATRTPVVPTSPKAVHTTYPASVATPPDPTATTESSVPRGRIKWDDEAIGPPAADSPRKQLSPENLYEQIAPSVVTIKVKDDDEEHIATGSGFFVDKELVEKRYAMADFYKSLASRETQNGTPTKYAYVLTNYPVIRPAVSSYRGRKG
jgi:hypothetical protein